MPSLFRRRLRNTIGHVEYRSDVIGAHSGQTDLEITAIVDGRAVGQLEFSEFQDEVSISIVEVDKDYQGHGIGRGLITTLQRMYPKVEIFWGMMTDEGAALKEACKDVLFMDTVRIGRGLERKERLKVLSEREKVLMEELDKLTGGSARYQDRIDAIGEELNWIADEVWRIHREEE